MSTPFRHHHQAPDGPFPPLLRHLTQEWPVLCHSPAAARTVEGWAVREPALAGLNGPAGVVDAIDGEGRERGTEILRALLRASQDGQQLAGRILLQAMLPKLSRLARYAPSSDKDERWQITVTCFWEVISRFPVARRTAATAANLALDTLHLITDSRPSQVDIPIVDYVLSSRLDRQSPWPVYALGDLSCDDDLGAVLGWAVGCGVLSSDEAQLLAVVYSDDGYGYAQAADRWGISQDAARKRCSRSTRKLGTAARAELLATG